MKTQISRVLFFQSSKNNIQMKGVNDDFDLEELLLADTEDEFNKYDYDSDSDNSNTEENCSLPLISNAPIPFQPAFL